MSKRIQDVATNKNEPEDTPFSLTKGKSIRKILIYWTKEGQFLYGYATEN